jgi:hypothetical protein
LKNNVVCPTIEEVPKRLLVHQDITESTITQELWSPLR